MLVSSRFLSNNRFSLALYIPVEGTITNITFSSRKFKRGKVLSFTEVSHLTLFLPLREQCQVRIVFTAPPQLFRFHNSNAYCASSISHLCYCAIRLYKICGPYISFHLSFYRLDILEIHYFLN